MTLHHNSPGYFVALFDPVRGQSWLRSEDPLPLTHAYYSVCGFPAPGPRSADRVSVVRALWADIDVGKPGCPSSKVEALRWLELLECPPTRIVDSGHGYHAYWELTRPLDGTTTVPRGWQDRLCRDWPGLDSTGDNARVLRIPGTVTGDGYVTSVVAHYPDNLYDPDEFDPAAVPVRHEGSYTVDPRECLPFIDATSYDTWLRVGMALHTWDDSDVGLDVWDAWSARAGNYEPGVCDLKWATFGRRGGTSLGTILHLAREGGWVDAAPAALSDAIDAAMVVDPPPDAPMSGDFLNADVYARAVTGEVSYTESLGWMLCNQGLWSKDPSHGVRGVARFVGRTGNEALSKIAVARAALTYAAVHPLVSVELGRYDGNPDLLGCGGGTAYDLSTRAFRPLLASDYCTKALAVSPDPRAKCPLWESTVLEIMSGDVEMVAFLQRALGYTLTGSTREEVFFVLQGGGANGKSTLMEQARAIMGDYAVTTPFSTFVKRTGDSGIPNDLAALRGARLVLASEPPDGVHLDEAKIKQITGGDPVSARFLREEFFEYRPTYKIWLMTNPLPTIEGTDDGIWRRVCLVPFREQFDIDTTLKDRLARERVGILNWMLAGHEAWLVRGLDPPTRVVNANHDYREEEDPFSAFASDYLDFAPKHWVLSRVLRESYSNWVRQTEGVTLSAKRMSKELQRRGASLERSPRGERGYKGVMLK